MSTVVFLIAVLIAFSLAARLWVHRLRAWRVDVPRTLIRRSEPLVVGKILSTPLSRQRNAAPPTHHNAEHFVEAVWSDVARRWASSWTSSSRTPIGSSVPRRP